MNIYIKKYLNQKLEIIHYIYFLLKVDKKFRLAVGLSTLLLVISVSKLLYEINIFALFGIVFSIIGLIFSFLKIRKYGSGDSKSEIYAEIQNFLPIGKSIVSFKDIYPSLNEIKEGFYTLDPNYNSGEFAVISDKINR